MRITTGMLNKHSGGLVPSRKSLLNYVQSGKTGGSSRLNALMAKSGRTGGTATRYTRAGYERLAKSAGSLEEQAGSLGEKADLGKASAADVEKLLADYNDTLSNLKSSEGALNRFYQQTLQQTAADNLDALSEIGISYGADGRLSLSRTRFERAQTEEISAVLGNQSSFVKRLGIVASRVSDNATANMQTASNRYGAGGNNISSYFSKYNFLG